MTALNVSISPNAVVNGNGLFGGSGVASTDGLVQGTAYPDPATTWQLRGGLLSSAETLPMWGGVGVYEFVPGGAGNPNYSLGPIMGRATALTGTYALRGFSVFDQAYGMVTTPNNPVPIIGSGGQVAAYRLGSGARIAVPCDPGLIDIRGEDIGTTVAWDYVNQLLIPYQASINVSSATYDSNTTISSGIYNSTTGLATLTLAASSHLAPGNVVTISAATGTGAYAALNGTFVCQAGTTGTTVTVQLAAGLTMTITGGTFVSGLVVLTLGSQPNVGVGDTITVSGFTGTNAAGVNITATVTSIGVDTVSYAAAGGLAPAFTGTGAITTGSAIPVDVLDVQASNCMTVSYVDGQATWNNNGSAAIIQI